MDRSFLSEVKITSDNRDRVIGRKPRITPSCVVMAARIPISIWLASVPSHNRHKVLLEFLVCDVRFGSIKRHSGTSARLTGCVCDQCLLYPLYISRDKSVTCHFQTNCSAAIQTLIEPFRRRLIP